MTVSKVPAQITELIERGAIFVINHSAGKDSQAMTIYLKQIVPADQLFVVHSHLPGMEWPGTIEHIRNTIGNLELQVCQAVKTFEEMVERRGMFPSPQHRQCTSDLKRTPIERTIRHYVKDRENKLIVNCMGMRAQESPRRAKATVFKYNKRNSKAGREWYDWLPIHGFTTEQVFQTIADANQKPHWAYEAGSTRLSCALCIMASQNDLRIGAKHNPETYKRLCALEKKFDQSMMMPTKAGRRFLPEIIGEE